MNEIIKELWYGKIDPQECGNLIGTGEMKKLTEYMARHMDELVNTLTEEQKELLEKYNDSRNEYKNNYHAAVFEYGFRLGQC